MNNIETSVQYAINIANNNYHGYSQPRRGVRDKDCSSLVIDALGAGGFATGSATYTGNMLNPLLDAGFVDVSYLINKITGSGLVRGDILLRPKTWYRNGHTAFYIGDGNIVQAAGDYDNKHGDSSGREIRIQGYYNSPFTYVLRYPVAHTAFEIGSRATIWGAGFPSSNGTGAETTKGIGKTGTIKRIAHGAKCPYGVSFASNVIDAWFTECALTKNCVVPPVVPIAIFKFRITCKELNVRSAANSTTAKIVAVLRRDQVVEISEASGTWGKLLDGRGWISLKLVYGKKE